MTLWRPALRGAFAHRATLTRKEAHRPLNNLRTLRNRIAHHEPVFARDLARDHERIVEVLGWMTPGTRRWIEHLGLNDPDGNFHGLTVSVRLPSVEAVRGPRWTVAADIVDCPELELVLPARKETVETAFLGEMRDAARLAIYCAMAADSDPRPSYQDRKRAHEADIDIAPPSSCPGAPASPTSTTGASRRSASPSAATRC